MAEPDGLYLPNRRRSIDISKDENFSSGIYAVHLKTTGQNNIGDQNREFNGDAIVLPTRKILDKVPSKHHVRSGRRNHAELLDSTETDTTDDSTLFYVNCKSRCLEDDDVVSGIYETEDHVSLEARSGPISHGKDQRVYMKNDHKHQFQSTSLQLSSEFYDDDVEFKAQILNFEETDDFDEGSVSPTCISRLSMFDNVASQRVFLPVVEAVPLAIYAAPDNFAENNTTISQNISATNRNNNNIQAQEISKDNNSAWPRFSVTESLNRVESLNVTQNQILNLRKQGFPLGLSFQVVQSKEQYPIHFWVVDNSGSMRTSDGREIRKVNIQPRNVFSFRAKDLTNTYVASCTRWTELHGAVADHAELAELLQMPTVFRLLNDPGPTVGTAELTVACRKNFDSSSVHGEAKKAVTQLDRVKPQGATPLTSHLLEFRQRVLKIQSDLQQSGRSAVLVIATDGLPTDETGSCTDDSKKRFLKVLRSLHRMPVWIVIRLCTNDDDVVSYYNNIDKELEIQLEVIDDYFGEAKEIYQCNSWLNYALPLHRSREMGFHNRLFDILDERLLNKDELLEFLELLFGRDRLINLPNIHTQWKEFIAMLTRVVRDEGKQWCPTTRKMEYWVDLKCLDRIYGSKRFLWPKVRDGQNTTNGVKNVMKSLSASFRYKPNSSLDNQPIDERSDVLAIRARNMRIMDSPSSKKFDRSSRSLQQKSQRLQTGSFKTVNASTSDLKVTELRKSTPRDPPELKPRLEKEPQTDKKFSQGANGKYEDILLNIDQVEKQSIAVKEDAKESNLAMSSVINTELANKVHETCELREIAKENACVVIAAPPAQAANKDENGFTPSQWLDKDTGNSFIEV